MELDPVPQNKIRVIGARKREWLLGSQLNRKYWSLKIISFFTSYCSYHKNQNQLPSTSCSKSPPLLAQPPSSALWRERVTLCTDCPIRLHRLLGLPSNPVPSDGPSTKPGPPLLPARNLLQRGTNSQGHHRGLTRGRQVRVKQPEAGPQMPDSCAHLWGRPEKQILNVSG